MTGLSCAQTEAGGTGAVLHRTASGHGTKLNALANSVPAAAVRRKGLRKEWAYRICNVEV